MRKTEIKRRTISIPALNLNYYGGIIESIDIYGIRYTRDLDLDVLRIKIDDLKEENAELRKLVMEMWHELDAATQYDAGGGRGVVSEFADRMRELE